MIRTYYIKNGRKLDVAAFPSEQEAKNWQEHMITCGFVAADTDWKMEYFDQPAPSYAQLRVARYQTEIDPFINEAIMENMQGRPAKMQALLAKREEIRKQYPKPQGVNDNGEQ